MAKNKVGAVRQAGKSEEKRSIDGCRQTEATCRACAQHYDEVVRPKLDRAVRLQEPDASAALDKIVLNMGIGEATADSKLVQVAVAELEKIAGQKAVITKARKAIATFKIRENLAIGAKVTLRKTRMYEFLDRLITIALPRVRDFRGLSDDELRRQRQLCDGHQGAHHFPGDRLRQDRSGLGPRCDRLHDGQYR